MSRPLLYIAAEEARRLLAEHGLEGEDAELAIQSETMLSEILGRLAEADAADEAAIAQCSVRGKELQLRIERIKHRRERRREEMTNALLAANVPKLPCGTCTISLRAVEPTARIVEPEKIPAKFGRSVITTTLKVDTDAVKQALQAGEDVPGAVLSNARKSVTVRRT